MTRNSWYLSVAAGVTAILGMALPVWAQAPSLGSAQSFAVLAGATVTNTGPSAISGNVGVSPGSAIIGFPPGLITNGTAHAADAAALSAQNSVTPAYNQLASLPCTQDLTGQDLGGKSLTPGVYCFSSSAQLTGTLTLNAQGNSNALFVFKMGSTLTTASGSSVVMINGSPLCNVFWQVGSSATLGTATSFIGNILANASITMTTGARLEGRALARTGAVTLDANTINASCLSALPPVPPGACPPLMVSPATLPNGSVGVAYTQQLTASGGTAPYRFAVVSGTLPAGISLSPDGLLSGTPTAAGTANSSVRVLDANDCPVVVTFAIVIAVAPAPPPGCPPVTLAPATLPNGTLAVAYTQTITGSGGTAPYTFAVISGTLPVGLTLTPAGVLAGTPTAVGTTTVTIRGTDANGCFANITYTIVIAAAAAPPPGCPPITLAPGTLPTGTINVAYNQTITGSGGTAPYIFGITSGTLPTGMTLSAAGVLSGTPTAAGTATVTIRGTDANGCFAERAFTISIATAVPTLPQVFVGLLALGLTGVGYLRMRRRARP